MKVLITTDWYAPTVNGVVTSVLNLRRRLTAMGHEVRVLTLAGSLASSTADGVTALGSIDAGLIYPGARLRSAMAGAAVSELIAWHPDVVHSQCEFSTFFLAKKIARACGVPLVHTYHTVYEDYTHYFSPVRTWGRAMVKGFSRAVLRNADATVAPTQKVYDLLMGYGVKCPVTVIPSGIEPARFSEAPTAEWVAQTRAALGIPVMNKVLLYVGRLAKEKMWKNCCAAARHWGNSPSPCCWWAVARRNRNCRCWRQKCTFYKTARWFLPAW